MAKQATAEEVGVSAAIREAFAALGNAKNPAIKDWVLAKYPGMKEKAETATFGSTASGLRTKLYGGEGTPKKNQPSLFDEDEPSGDELLAVLVAAKDEKQGKSLKALSTVQALAAELTGGSIVKLINALNKLKVAGLI